jgi:hypothetical protein
MITTRRKTSIAVCALALLAAVVLLLFRGCTAAVTADNGSGNADTGGSAQPVLIAGDVVEPISPGVMVPLDLEFTNPHDVDLSITALSVVVHDVTAPNSDQTHTCVLDDFAVDQAPSDLTITVAAGATSTLSGLGLPSTMWPRMGMHDRPVNQDGCKGASLTLDYTASGTRGER